MSDEGEGANEIPQWSIHTDGSSNKQAGGAGIVLLSPEGDMVECMVRPDFPTTNNEAEYEALMARLDLAKVAGAESVIIYCDSQIITHQVNGDYECKNERMQRYLDQVRKRVSDLKAKVIRSPKEKMSKPTALPKPLQENI